MASWKRKEERQRLRAATIPNPRIKRLLKLDLDEQEDIINVFLKVAGNAEPFYKSILDVEYYKISNIRKIISKDTDIFDTIEIIHQLTDMSYKKIIRLRALEVIKMHNFVKIGFKEINRLESTLNRKQEAAEVKAGIEKLNKYSELISVKSVMTFYVEKWKEAVNRPYAQCFAIWSMNVDKSDFDKSYFKIKTKITKKR